ncbi:D-lactate dehydrogenase [Meridianimarinicoccus roseus]|uniref:Quinone-dependent D-lactate dehydrogenase n=1 Tax=Meridianimarinicoccus roseus TaxID=2072018 RepID=A0A2V2LEZ2_9RHOB|nr:D-lactate dehydrogenase [Meridianimarinicoccus roseus]PWR04170.1 D-lactate dehydrogenase [Meridianimarinicoccus roseus]
MSLTEHSGTAANTATASRPATATADDLVGTLVAVVGKRHCLTDPRKTERYRKGFRSGDGEATAVVVPGSLTEMWRVLQACVAADAIILMQAANTGLTEGSTPKGSYNRPVVIISTLRMDKIHLLDEGRQIVSLPGGTLFNLEAILDPYGRQPHSVIGSSCIGASILGGVCNNSGGSLVRRGPSFTELSLFARINADGQLELVNHLGIDLGNDPDEMLTRLEKGAFGPDDVHPTGRASDDSYPDRVRDVQAETPARFNADPRGLFEASGSAGKIAVFAVRLDTFPVETGEKVYYIGTNAPSALTALRRRLLMELPELPISGEYLHRDCFDVARSYGKDTLLMIHWLGTRRLPGIFALKGAIDARLNKLRWLPHNLSDRAMQVLSRLMPEALPKRMLAFREAHEHHLILKVSGTSAAKTEEILTETVGSDGWFLCDAAEAKKAMLHRFAAAGAAVRYGAVHADTTEDILALDIALRRNDDDWVESLPPEIDDQIAVKLYYGHFLCHVFHQDYVVKKGADPKALKAAMLALLDRRGAEYPAEHNVGHLYAAKPPLQAHYRALDPTNSFNPGIGKMSRDRHYGGCCDGAGAGH